MERLKDLSALEWLTAQKQYWWCGFDVDVGERSTWILHAMYEDAGLPGGLSHDDAYRIPRAADPPEPSVGFVEGDVRQQLDAATVIGCPSGKSARPGPHWRRLPWRERARRLGVNLFAALRLPYHRSFPHRSWPANIRPPAEGTLDREQYRRLLERLAAHSPDGDHTTCFALYAGCWTGGVPQLFRGQASRST